MLFTVIVTVSPKTWKVNVIGIASPPFREVWPTACRVVQRLTAEAAIIGYHISTRHAIGKISTEKSPGGYKPPGVI